MNTFKKVVTGAALLFFMAFFSFESTAKQFILPGEFIAAEIDPCCVVWCQGTDGVCAIISSSSKIVKVNSPTPLNIRFQDWQTSQGTINGQKAVKVQFIGGEIIK